MTAWVIKALRASTVIVSLGTVGGGVAYLTNNNEKQTINTISAKDENEVLIEIEDLQNNAGNFVHERPILKGCREKWKSKDWNYENDKLCKGIYITSEEEKQFWLSL